MQTKEYKKVKRSGAQFWCELVVSGTVTKWFHRVTPRCSSSMTCLGAFRMMLAADFHLDILKFLQRIESKNGRHGKALQNSNNNTSTSRHIRVQVTLIMKRWQIVLMSAYDMLTYK